jgi:hypothetical protein
MITNTFSLKVTFIELEDIGSNIRLYLKPKMPLISTEKSLPPRGEMHVVGFQCHDCCLGGW